MLRSPQLEPTDFIIKVVQQLGFPIFVSVWLLIQGNRQHAANLLVLSAMQTQLTELTTTMRVMMEFVRDGYQERRRIEDRSEG